MRPSRVVDVVRAGPSRCRASIVAIMAKVNRRAKVPEQNASRRPSRTGETPIRRRWPPGRWAGFVLILVRPIRTR